MLARLSGDNDTGTGELADAVERDAEVWERTWIARAEVSLAARLAAHVGATVTFDVHGGGPVTGTLRHVGDGWAWLGDRTTGDVLVVLSAACRVSELGGTALPPHAQPVSARLGLGAVLRELARTREPVVVVDRRGAVLRGVLVRVGQDHVDVAGGHGAHGPSDVVPFGAIALVRPAGAVD